MNHSLQPSDFDHFSTHGWPTVRLAMLHLRLKRET